MIWNDSLKIFLGFVLGSVLSSSLIVSLQLSELAQALDSIVKFSTILIAPLTFGSMIFSWNMVAEARRTREQNSEPHVIVTIEPNRFHNFFDLVISNEGSGAAYSLAARFEPEMIIKDQQGKVKVQDTGILRVAVLKPKQSFSHFLGNWDDFETLQTKVTVTYKDARRVFHTSTNQIDLSVFEGMGKLGGDDVHDIKSNLEKMRKAIESISGSNKRVGIDTYNSEDRAAEQQKIREWHEQQIARQTLVK